MDYNKILGKGLNGKVYEGKIILHTTGKEESVAIKEYEGERFGNALYEIINNSRIIEKHPNVVPLKAVQFDFD